MDPRRSIQIDDDPAFQRKGWVFERVGWAGLAGLLAAAMLGAFGSGALSSAEQREGGTGLRYQRILRYQAPATLELEFARSDGQVRVFLSRDWLEGATLERTSPPAGPAVLKDDGVVLVFAADPAMIGGRIRMDFRPDRIGWHGGEIGLEGAPPIAIRALVLP